MIDAKIDTAIERIKDIYNETDGKCVISFSGGKDSTILAELYLIAKKRGEVGYIPLIFADTQVEYLAIYDFIEWYSKNKQEVIYLKPRKPFAQVLKEYGKPAMSKVKSEFLSTYQKTLKNNKDPLKVKRTSELILGVQTDKDCNPKIVDDKTLGTRQRLANQHFNFLHPLHEYKISAKCCDYLKKYPFDDYYKQHNIKGFMTGMRSDEAGVRSVMYKSCTAFKMMGNVKLTHKMPLWYWKDDDIETFISMYNVKISEAYTKYGLERTGCIGCPFAKDIYKNLKVLYDYEPNKYKAVQNWLGEVYIDLDIDLPFDFEYTIKKDNRNKQLQIRRYEMLKKYRKEIAYKYKPQPAQQKLNIEE